MYLAKDLHFGAMEEVVLSDEHTPPLGTSEHVMHVQLVLKRSLSAKHACSFFPPPIPAALSCID
jgi:hypothetical protein